MKQSPSSTVFNRYIQKSLVIWNFSSDSRGVRLLKYLPFDISDSPIHWTYSRDHNGYIENEVYRKNNFESEKLYLFNDNMMYTGW